MGLGVNPLSTASLGSLMDLRCGNLLISATRTTLQRVDPVIVIMVARRLSISALIFLNGYVKQFGVAVVCFRGSPEQVSKFLVSHIGFGS
jgi:molybdate-binding protein